MWQVKIYEEKRCDGIFKDVFQVQEKRYICFLAFLRHFCSLVLPVSFAAQSGSLSHAAVRGHRSGAAWRRHKERLF